VYLREDSVSGASYLENQAELRAATADVAACLLDAAIAARTVPGLCALSHCAVARVLCKRGGRRKTERK